MTRAIAALCLLACAAPQPLPERVADEVQIQQVQIGWAQIATGQMNRPPVNDLKSPKPDMVQAEEVANTTLAACEKGMSMEQLQDRLSEEPPGTITVNLQTKKAFRDYALSLKPGQCGLFRSNYAFHVIKRVG